MAGRGPAPKDPAKRLRRNADDVPASELEARPVAAPKLPGSSRLLPATRAWYRVWSTSPQAQLFIATDWQRLHQLALLVDAYYREPSKELMAEIRLNEAKLGATPEDRLRLRWRLAQQADDGGEQETSGQAPAKSRRRDPRLSVVK